MNCPNCSALNDSESVFCVSCGSKLGFTGGSFSDSSGVGFDEETTPPAENAIETEVVRFGSTPLPVSESSANRFPESDKKKIFSLKTWLMFLGGILALSVVALGGYFFLSADERASSLGDLPDHFGIFSQNKEQTVSNELTKYDFSDALLAKEEFLRKESIPTLDADSLFVLYSDGKDIPLGDLRLMKIDTLSSDGSFKQLDFQAAPVDGKPAMKRIRIPSGFSNGRYAFAILDGYLEEGNHKFWPFFVRNSKVETDENALKSSNLRTRPPKEPSMPPATNSLPPSISSPPQGGRLARIITTGLIMRTGPTQRAQKIRSLRYGEQVYVLGYSSNSEVFKGTVSTFAHIQTADGRRGWAFAVYVQ